MSTDYAAFLESKRLVVPAAGIDVPPERLNSHLFPFQAAIVHWALRKGRAACFAGTGLGKTRIQLAWGEHAADRVLVLAPLAVAQQTVREGERIGIPVVYARRQDQAPERGLTITNYELLKNFNHGLFGAVVLDESGILKAYDGKTRTALIEAFRRTPMRFCCTATPAPNDISELTNHSEFLGAMTRQEMIAAFFINRSAGKDLQLKRHGREAFYRWLASWGMSLEHPADLGFDQPGYDLPPLSVTPVFVEVDYQPTNRLFAERLEGVTERAHVRRATITDRVQVASEIVNGEPDEPWLIWGGLNDETEAITRAIPGAVEVTGSDRIETKIERLLSFVDGRVRVLVTKPLLAGHGLNLQHCARMLFLGLNDSFEGYYQAVRRCWRFGQHREVKVWVVLSEPERVIWENVRQKEQQAAEMRRELIRHVADWERAELSDRREERRYRAEQPLRLPRFLENGNGRKG